MSPFQGFLLFFFLPMAAPWLYFSALQAFFPLKHLKNLSSFSMLRSAWPAMESSSIYAMPGTYIYF
jgi:hypothetical protein